MLKKIIIFVLNCEVLNYVFSFFLSIVSVCAFVCGCAYLCSNQTKHDTNKFSVLLLILFCLPFCNNFIFVNGNSPPLCLRVCVYLCVLFDHIQLTVGFAICILHVQGHHGHYSADRILELHKVISGLTLFSSLKVIFSYLNIVCSYWCGGGVLAVVHKNACVWFI